MGTGKEETQITTRIRPDGPNRRIESGTEPGHGTFFCLGCGTQLALEENDALPPCPSCEGTTFRRDSIFEPMQDHSHTTAELSLPPARPERPDWVAEAREAIPGPGHYLAFREGEEVRLVTLAEGWTRIGRSAAADLRLDHPSVSRRHAMIACEPPKALRVLDDRSLNGVQVNGATLEWSRLGDGDELMIGRYRLFVLEP